MGDLHPDRFGIVLNDVTTTGINANDGDFPESTYLKCKKCGYIMSSARHSTGRGEGRSQPYTQLNGAVTAGDTTITVDSTTGFPTPVTDIDSFIYIYDIRNSTGDSGTGMNRVQYTGLAATTFTGCTNVKVHADDMYVRGEVTGSGCPFCHTFNFK